MIDYFWWYATTMGFLCVLVGLLCLYRYFLGNRLLDATKKLRAEINRMPKDVLDFVREPSANIGSALGEIGIGGILEELGVPSMFKPMIEGFLSNPENLAKIQPYLDKLGINLKQKGGKGANAKEEEIPLL